MSINKYDLYAVIFAVLFASISFCAKADGYMKFTAGKTHYTHSGVWEDSGYEAKSLSSPMFGIGIGKSTDLYNIEATILYLGRFELDALWGNPDDPEHSTSTPTTVGIQGGDVTGLTLAFIPKKSFAGGDIHANLGLIYYRATWTGDFFNTTNTHGQTFNEGPHMGTKSVTWFAGLGATYGKPKSTSFSLDMNYYPVSVDGKKYTSTWSGGGGYKAVKTLEISVKVPF